MSSGKTSKRSKATVVAAGGILAVGIYLGSLFRGPGAGGDAVGTGQPGTAEQSDTMVIAQPTPGVEPDLELPEQSEPDFASDPPIEPAAPEQAAPEPTGPPEMIAVLVGEEQYLISVDRRAPQRATLEQIAEIAQTTTGTPQGLRVQIRYDESARVIDDKRLKETLEGAGIGSTATQVVVPEKFQY